ncbi:MAG: CBS domain-containing protein [Methanobacteriaceae archaeon]|jgi:CBS domain-containing protein
MLSGYLVRDVMSRGVYTVMLNDSLQDIIKLMDNNNISSSVVVDEKGTYWGIITSMDVLKHCTGNIDKLKAEDVIVTDTITVSPVTPLEEAGLIMVENRIHHLYVADERRRQKIVGVLSSKDIIKFMSQALK